MYLERKDMHERQGYRGKDMQGREGCAGERRIHTEQGGINMRVKTSRRGKGYSEGYVSGRQKNK